MENKRIRKFESQVLVALGVRYLVKASCGFSGSQYQAYWIRSFSFVLLFISKFYNFTFSFFFCSLSFLLLAMSFGLM